MAACFYVPIQKYQRTLIKNLDEKIKLQYIALIEVQLKLLK